MNPNITRTGDEVVIRLGFDAPDLLTRIESILKTVAQPEITERLDRIEETLAKICAALEQERGDEVLDIDGAVKLTGLSKSAIYGKTSWVEGQPPAIPHYKRGKRLYFKRSELEAWLTENPRMDRKRFEQAVADKMRELDDKRLSRRKR